MKILRKILRKLVGWPLSNLLFLLGDGAYRILNALPDHGWERAGHVGFRIYAGLMGASIDVNAWADLNVWKKADEAGVQKERAAAATR